MRAFILGVQIVSIDFNASQMKTRMLIMFFLSLALARRHRGKFLLAGLLIALCEISAVTAWAGSRAMGKGTLRVFAVGISHYRNSMIDLQYADNDAETLAAALQDT